MANLSSLLYKEERIKRASIAFWINLPICLVLIIVFKSIDSQILWKIIASSIGFIVFLSLTILLLRLLIRLQ